MLNKILYYSVAFFKTMVFQSLTQLAASPPDFRLRQKKKTAFFYPMRKKVDNFNSVRGKQR